MVNIEFKRDQDLNPWRYRTIINGSQIKGPLRPDPTAARQDRTRMEKELQDLREEGKAGTDLADAMRNRAKVLKDEVKMVKKQQTKEKRKVSKRESYRASQEAKQQASQLTQNQEDQQQSQQDHQDQQRAKGSKRAAALGRPD